MLINSISANTFKGYIHQHKDPYAAAFAEMARQEREAMDRYVMYEDVYDVPSFENDDRNTEILSRLHNDRVRQRRKEDRAEAKILRDRLKNK